jgi:hypothetical protein
MCARAMTLRTATLVFAYGMPPCSCRCSYRSTRKRTCGERRYSNLARVSKRQQFDDVVNKIIIINTTIVIGGGGSDVRRRAGRVQRGGCSAGSQLRHRHRLAVQHWFAAIKKSDTSGRYALQGAKENLDANAFPAVASVCVLNWHSPEACAVQWDSVDTVIASDVVWLQHLVLPLVKTINYAASRNRNITVIMSNQER